MDLGVLVPQGWKHEYDGWDPASAWARSVELARESERLGFESVWVFDHFHTVPDPTDEITFESFTMLAALTQVTSRVRMGHMVVCNGFRNPGLVAKMASTLDVMSGGRFELGIGAGWKKDEWLAYGYGFPPIAERLGALADGLEVITRMLAPGHATYDGRYASVADAINVPRGIQEPRLPIVVGGNGRDVTGRLAARFAEEWNWVFIDADEVREYMGLARERCEEIGRDPATLRTSLYVLDEDMQATGQRRVDVLGALAETGLDRAVAFPGRWDPTVEGLGRFAEDARAAGIELARGAPV